MQHRYYPLFVTLDERVCLVVGGGKVGERKIRGIQKHGASIRLIAQTLTPWLQDQCDQNRIQWVSRVYEEFFLDGVDLVFAATSDADLNLRIAADARNRKIWCNLATDPHQASFIVPAVFEQGFLTVAISTAGLSPALAKIIREKLEREFGPEWNLFLMLMGELRSAIQSKGLESSENQRLFREIANLPLPDWIKAERRNHALDAAHRICQPLLSFQELSEIWDKVWKVSSLSSPPSATAVEP